MIKKLITLNIFLTCLSIFFFFPLLHPFQPVNSIKHIHVIGIQSSGTSFVESLIRKNIKNVSIVSEISTKNDDHSLWKHGYIDEEALCKCKECIFVHIYRNPYNWLRSIYTHPYHMDPDLFKLPFSQWLRTTWKKTYKAANPVFEDKDPETGKLFENVIKLRTNKLKHFENLKHKVKNFYSVGYETINQDPQSFLKNIATLFSLQLKKKYTSIVFYRGDDGEKKNIYYKKKKYPDFTPEDLDFINKELDWDLEDCSFGYKINQYEKNKYEN